MSIFKRGDTYWYNFWWGSDHIQRSTHQSNPRVARQMEAAHRTALAKGEVGIFERKPIPTLKDFGPRFTEAIKVRCAAKPRTVAFYEEKLERLLSYEPLAQSRLDRIDEALIEQYVVKRREKVSTATVNRDLATLRRLLRMAHEWKLIMAVPRIRLLSGEHMRDFVLDYPQEKIYLAAAPQPLHDVALLILETGLRLGEALRLEGRDIHLVTGKSARFGYLHVRDGKSRHARRNVPLTERAAAMLQERLGEREELIFPSDGGQPYLVTSLDHLHEKVRKKLGMPKGFVIHSLRHTMLTRLGESGAEAFYIMRIAGHSSVTISQRYVHPTPEGLERTMERFNEMNKKASKKRVKRQPPTTIPTTLAAAASASH